MYSWSCPQGRSAFLAANQFTLDRLRNKLRVDILAVCQDVMGCTPALEFHISDAGKKSEQSPEISSGEQPAGTTMNTLVPSESAKIDAIPRSAP